MLTKICKRSGLSLSFSYEHTLTEVINLRPVKAVHRDERVLSLAEVDKIYEVKQILLKKHAHRAFCWPKYTDQDLHGRSMDNIRNPLSALLFRGKLSSNCKNKLF